MPDSEVFDRISRTLDRSFRYLIIGSNIQKRIFDVQRDITDALEHSGIYVLEEKVYLDHKLNRQYVVLKLDRDSSKTLNLETLYAVMPKDVFWYFYENT